MDGFDYRNFAAWPDLPREVIRGVVRDLRDMGLVEYGKGLWTEEGEMGGSGYRLTALGRAFMDYHEGKEEQRAGVGKPFYAEPVTVVKRKRLTLLFWRKR